MVYFGLHALSWTHGLAPMWSGLYIISTWNNIVALITLNECQCPLGLIPHFYIYRIDFTSNMIVIVSMPSRAYTSFLHLVSQHHKYWRYSCVNALSGLYLISTKMPFGISSRGVDTRVNALSGLYLISTVISSASLDALKKIVSMPSRAYTSFLRYPFKSLGFMRFPEPVFAGIYQNILTTAVFRAC